MKSNKYIIPLTLVAFALAGCDDQIMEWQEKDNTIGVADLPLELKEKIGLYAPIKSYVQQYHPNLNFALGMGADMYLSNDTYKALVDENFTGVTLGNAMKFGVVCGNSGTLNFSTVDQIMTTLPADMKLYGHNLLWHTQQPQTYLKSLIAPKMIITTDGGGVANMLSGDASNFNGGTLGGWMSWGSNKDEVTVDATGGKDGTPCAKLTNGGDGSSWQAQFLYELGEAMSSSETYVIKFKAKSTSAAGELQFQYQNSNSGSQGGYNTFSVGTSWTECEYEFTPSADDVTRIVLNFGEVDGTYWVDDIEFGIKVEDAMNNVLTGDSSDFEGGTLGSWMSWGSNKDSVEAGEGVGNNGSYGAVLKNSGDGNSWEAQFVYELSEPLKAGTIYVVQFDAKSTSAAGVIQFQYQNSKSGSQGGYNDMAVGTDWNTYEYEFTTTYDDVTRIVLNFGKVGATYYVDNIKFGDKKNQTAAAAPAKVIKHVKRAKAAKGVKRRASTITYELKTSAEKREALLGAMESWIKSMMQHVGDRVDAWDVINEPIADGSNKWRGIDGTFGGSDNDGNADSAPTETTDGGLSLNWASDSGNQHWYWGYYLGKDYAVKAFEFARKYSTNNAKLFVNDYNLETSPAKLQALIEFVNYIDQNGGQVDGIGTQMHVTKSITKDEVDAMFKTMAATGKLVRITELDVAMDTATPSTEQAATQASIYQMIIESYFENVPESQQSSITLWTLSDNAKEHEYWLNGDTPNIFDTNYARKHAYKAVCDALAGFDISTTFTGTDWKTQYQNADE